MADAQLTPSTDRPVETAVPPDPQWADLDYPIIFAAEGRLMDGTHRIAKAYALGLSHLEAVRFTVTPEPDERRPRPAPPSSG
jgi:hypothetical protein